MRQQTLRSYLFNERPAPEPRPFEDAERIPLAQPDGDVAVFVVLSMLELRGRDYAMLAREDELEDLDEVDMSVYLFEVERLVTGEAKLHRIEDDETYAEIFHLFSAIMDEEDEFIA